MKRLETAQLHAAYRYCRHLNARHGRTFYLATALLPADRRPAVHALYGFARYADDIVDNPVAGRPAADRLAELSTQLHEAFGCVHSSTHPVVRAVVHTASRHDIDPSLFDDFLASMASDLTVTRYPTFDALRGYMWGSASVIGIQLLPVLGLAPGADPDEAREAASDLGIAFQLTNFLRDIAEDHRRGRVYIPLDSLASHGVSVDDLGAPRANEAVRSLVADEIERARAFYRAAERGIDLLARESRDCVRTAHVLYGDILNVIAAAGFDPLVARAQVGLARRARVGASGYLAAVKARRR